MSTHGTYTTVDGRPAVRFERRLPHPVEAVWRAVTEPAELARWFPCEVAYEPRAGAPMTFIFAPDLVQEGEVLELEPPRRFAFRWGADLLRLELEPDGEGTRLTMVHVLETDGPEAAARNAAGWHLCLDALGRVVAGEPDVVAPAGPTARWRTLYDGYVAAGMPSGAPVPGLDGA